MQQAPTAEVLSHHTFFLQLSAKLTSSNLLNAINRTCTTERQASQGLSADTVDSFYVGSYLYLRVEWCLEYLKFQLQGGRLGGTSLRSLNIVKMLTVQSRNAYGNLIVRFNVRCRLCGCMPADLEVQSPRYVYYVATQA